MVRSASSSGVNAARGTSLLQRLTQYAQSYTHTLVMRTLSNEMHRPSGVKPVSYTHLETDFQILNLSQALYKTLQLKRVFFSAYLPVSSDERRCV